MSVRVKQSINNFIGTVKKDSVQIRNHYAMYISAQDRLSERVRQVIHREFGRALRDKEEEADTIQNRLTQVRKAMHMVRYAVVANYYSGGALIKVRKTIWQAYNVKTHWKTLNHFQQSTSQPEEVSIHPATRSILAGKKPASLVKEDNDSKQTNALQVRTDDIKIEVEDSFDVNSTSLNPRVPSVQPCYVPPNPGQSIPEVTGAIRSASHRIKRRFVVGNVSKWIECDQREDLATHKWMLYVRGGDKDKADVSDVVSKVRFLIHPSYHPHDLVDVNSAPFHLTRRGWGEFAARVQIHFKRARDKPVDVIHHIKLDRTYTGLQTLGSETIVDVWLHNPDSIKKSEVGPVKSEAIIDKFVNAPEGLVIPHEDVSDVIGPDLLLMSSNGDDMWTREDSIADVEQETSPENASSTSHPASSQNAPVNGQTKIVVFKNANGDLQQQAVSLAQASELKKQHQLGIKTSTLSMSLNGRSPSPFAQQSRICPGKGKGKGKGRPSNKVLSVTNNSSVIKREAGASENGHQKVVVATANGISLVKERRVINRPTGRSSSPSASSTSSYTAVGTSLLRSSAATKPGRSLLKSSLSLSSSPCPSPTAVVTAITNGHGLTTHVVSTVTPKDTLTALERAIPEVSLQQWRSILGRPDTEEGGDSQEEVEERLQEKNWKLLKRQIDYLKKLSNALTLKASDFSSKEALVFRLVKYLPQVTPLAKDPVYRAVHPYAAVSKGAFKKWNIGKQLSSEVRFEI